MNNQLALMQLADSFFPSGSFTLSHGLEYLVQTKQVTESKELESFLQIILKNKTGSCDLVALIHAYRSSKNNDFEEVKAADKQLFCQTLIESNRVAQQKSGRALLRVAIATWQSSKLMTLQAKVATKEINCLQPIIFAVVAEVAGITEKDTVLAFLHNLITGLLGAAIRLGIIGHLQAQKTLLNLAPDMEQAYKQALTLSLAEMWSCTPTIDLAQMQHQKLKSRLFAS